MLSPIEIPPGVVIPVSAVTVVAVRASGPGGQNVNKVSSKVEVRVDIAAIRGLRLDARARLLVLAAGRLDADGKILVTSQRTRDRERNLADALEKVSELVARALIVPTRAQTDAPHARLGGATPHREEEGSGAEDRAPRRSGRLARARVRRSRDAGARKMAFSSLLGAAD